MVRAFAIVAILLSSLASPALAAQRPWWDPPQKRPGARVRGAEGASERVRSYMMANTLKTLHRSFPGELSRTNDARRRLDLAPLVAKGWRRWSKERLTKTLISLGEMQSSMQQRTFFLEQIGLVPILDSGGDYVDPLAPRPSLRGSSATRNPAAESRAAMNRAATY